MGLRLRRSVKLFPGVRINLSLSGVSATIGPRGANINIGPRGTYANLGLPGTGLSYRTRLDKPASRSVDFIPSSTPQPEVVPVPAGAPASHDRTEYRSVRGDSISSPELRPLADLIATIGARRRRLGNEIASTDAAITSAERKILLGRSLLLRMLTRRRVGEIVKIKATLESQRVALAEQLESTAIDADFDLSEESRAAFIDLVQQFTDIRSCHVIWDISESTRIDRARTRSAASEGVTRHKVSFAQASLDAIESDFESLHLCNANGGDLFLFPCFLAIRKSDGNLALIDVRQVTLSVSSVRFIEEEVLPSDSERVGSAWARSNKDGSADRRFANNYQIPVVRYGQVFLSSATGLNEAYMVSNAGACERFGRAFQRYIATLPARGSGEIQSSAAIIDAPPALDIPRRPDIPSIMSGGAWAAALGIVLCVSSGAAWWARGPMLLSIAPPAAPRTATEPGPEVDTSSLPQNTPTEVKEEPAVAMPVETPVGAAVPASNAPDTPLTSDEIKALQERLKALGFDVGTADGVIGRRTVAAVKAYQTLHNMPATGAVDRRLFDHLKSQTPP